MLLAAERPNVILIYGDDVGYGDVGCYGAEKIATPNIDRLAREGLRFTDAHCASSTCTPSRYSLLTGELPFRKEGTNIAHGNANMIISPDQYTLADVFKDAGYKTAVIGKWHLGLDDEPINWNEPLVPGPEALGFDHHFLIPATNDRLPTVYVENNRVVNLDPEDPITVQRGKYREPIPDSVPGTSYPIAKLNPEAVTVYPGDAAHSGTVINGLGRIGKMKGGQSALFKDEDIADDLVREASEFIRAADDQPFFLFFSANDIHAPRWPHSRFHGVSQHGLRGDAMVSFDWSVGALLDLIEELGLEEDTLVILSSDNGPVYIDGGYEDGCEVLKSTGEVDRGHDASGPFRGGKYQIHEGGTRVPFIVRWPGVVEAGTTEALFTQTDLTATFADLLQVQIPEGQARDSRVQSNALKGKCATGADCIIQTSFKQRALRRGNLKYIADPPQLYDLSNDPGEAVNLIASKPELAQSLKSQLERSIERPLRSDPPPNIVFILADDMGFSDLGCYGGEIQTPHLDSLAAGGLRFTRHYNTGRCWPSRAALLTGHHAQAVNRDESMDGKRYGKRPQWARLLPEYLKSAGYRNYHSGKWHIDGKIIDAGFDRSFSFKKQDNFFRIDDATLDDKRVGAPTDVGPYYTTTGIATHAIDCLSSHARDHPDRPFFQYIAFTAPHFPLHALPEDIAKYRDRYLEGWEALREERHAKLKELGIVDGKLSEIERRLGPPYHFQKAFDILGPGEARYPLQWDDLSEEQKRFQATKMAIHAAMVDRMDQEIGRIIDQLKAMDALENTIIFFASDNGASAEIMVRGDGNDPEAAMGSADTYLCLGPGFSSASNTPFRRHKTWTHEGGISTPLIVHWPAGIEARGELRHTPGHFIDFVPTVFELAGMKPPAEWEGTPLPALPGRSLVPVFEKDTAEPHQALWWLHEGNRAIQRGDWKLVASRKDPWELYNLVEDRAERQNLARQYPEKVKQLGNAWQQLADRYARIRDGAGGRTRKEP